MMWCLSPSFSGKLPDGLDRSAELGQSLKQMRILDTIMRRSDLFFMVGMLFILESELNSFW